MVKWPIKTQINMVKKNKILTRIFCLLSQDILDSFDKDVMSEDYRKQRFGNEKKNIKLKHKSKESFGMLRTTV